MGGGLVPFPVSRFPCFFERKMSYTEWISEITHWDQFHMPKRVTVKAKSLGVLKTFLTILVIAYILHEAIWKEKTYLAKAPIQGYTRATLQHPVQRCNPLKANCKANFTAIKDLAYCNGSYKHSGANGTKSIGCTYHDEFDAYTFNTGTSNSNIMVPTRISRFLQVVKEGCSGESHKCTEPYKTVEESHEFTADIEDFTLLIDHGVLCEELHENLEAVKTQGFYRACPDEDVAEEECEVKHAVPPVVDKETFQGLEEYYDSTGPGIVQNKPYGDIISVRDLLKLANLELDKPFTENGNSTVREEGEVVIVDIHWMNYNEYHWPNRLPPVYMYNVHKVKAKTFKMTFVNELQNGMREVKDVHGIYLITRVTGKLGQWCWMNILFIYFEVFAALGIVHWLLACLSVNWHPCRRQGDTFYEKTEEQLDFETDYFELELAPSDMSASDRSSYSLQDSQQR